MAYYTKQNFADQPTWVTDTSTHQLSHNTNKSYFSLLILNIVTKQYYAITDTVKVYVRRICFD